MLQSLVSKTQRLLVFQRNSKQRRCYKPDSVSCLCLKSCLGGRRQLLYAAYPGIRTEVVPSCFQPCGLHHDYCPLFGLAPGGVFNAVSLAGIRGGLLPHLFTLTLHPNGVSHEWYRAVYFLLHYPSQRLNPPCPVFQRAPHFMESGLSSGKYYSFLPPPCPPLLPTPFSWSVSVFFSPST